MRTRISIALVLLAALGLTPITVASSVAGDRFTFARPRAAESTITLSDRLTLDVDRWSTDAERDLVATAIAEEGAANFLRRMNDIGRLGTLHWPGGLEYAVRYARQSPLPDGGTEVVVVVDRPLWLWWAHTAATTPYPFTVVQMRLGRDGRGEARASLGVPVAGDKVWGVVLSDYTKAPAVLTELRRERSTT